jgi:hypothetical protein
MKVCNWQPMRPHLCKSKGPRRARTPVITHWWRCSLAVAIKETCTKKAKVRHSLPHRSVQILRWCRSRVTHFWNFLLTSPHSHFLVNENTEVILRQQKRQLLQIKFWNRACKSQKTTQWAPKVSLHISKLDSIIGCKLWTQSSSVKTKACKKDPKQVLNAAQLEGARWLQ